MFRRSRDAEGAPVLPHIHPLSSSSIPGARVDQSQPDTHHHMLGNNPQTHLPNRHSDPVSSTAFSFTVHLCGWAGWGSESLQWWLDPTSSNPAMQWKVCSCHNTLTPLPRMSGFPWPIPWITGKVIPGALDLLTPFLQVPILWVYTAGLAHPHQF